MADHASRRSFLRGAIGLAALPSRAVAAPAPTCPAHPGGVPPDRLAALAKGFNLTGWVDAKPARVPDRAALKALRARGLTHVRLPVTAEFYLGEFAGALSAADQLGDLAKAVDELTGLGFAVSLDMHPGGEIGALRRARPDEAFDKLRGLWWRLATKFASHAPDRMFFEVLNEPSGMAEWREAVRLAALIRGIAPRHTIILGPPENQRIEGLEAIEPITDRNVVYAIHVYDPMAFTHQGLDWEGPDEPLARFRGVPFPSRPDHPAVVALGARLRAEGHSAAADALADQLSRPWGEPEIDALLGRAEAWSARRGAPVIVNEFGVLSWQAPPADRARWLRAVRLAAERRCIGWTHWDYADGFGFMRREAGRETPDPKILAALLGS